METKTKMMIGQGGVSSGGNGDSVCGGDGGCGDDGGGCFKQLYYSFFILSSFQDDMW